MTTADTTAPIVTDAQHRSNNFDALRLVGALAVIFGHAYHLVGRPLQAPFAIGYPVQTLGVVIFFSISGYLITASWSRTRNPLSYFAARFLRIFPGLIVVVLVCTFLVGPLVTTLTRGAYFGHDVTWSYLTNIVMKPQYVLPGVWADLPYPDAVNGSLWTLPAEFLCYLLVPVFFLVPKVVRPAAILAALLFAVYLSLTPRDDSAVIYMTRISDAAGMWVFFAAGALLRLASERGMQFRADVAVGLVAAYVLAIGTFPQHATKIAWIALPYAVLTIGLAKTPYVRRTARFGDFSYGLYLWAFPVQQLVNDVWGVQRMSVNLVVVTALTLVMAFLSWHLVEQPALKLKDRIVRRFSRRRAPVEPAAEPATAPEPVPASSSASRPTR